MCVPVIAPGGSIKLGESALCPPVASIYDKTLLNNDLHPLIADYLIDTVILLDCIDEILPSARYIGSPEDNEDVRCMYVAVTRAKNTLYMIVPKIVLKYGKA